MPMSTGTVTVRNSNWQKVIVLRGSEAKVTFKDRYKFGHHFRVYSGQKCSPNGLYTPFLPGVTLP